MVETKRAPHKSLTRTGFMNSEAVVHAKETWAYTKRHASLLSKIWRNWVSDAPISSARFDTTHIQYDEELGRLKQHAVTIDGSIYRPSGYGLALMVMLSVPGSASFVSACARAYAVLRGVYFKNPEEPWIALSEFRERLGLDDFGARRILLILNDISACSQAGTDAAARISISPTIRDKADIWGVFERIVSGYTLPISLGYGAAPFSGLNAAFHTAEAMYGVIGMCPRALEDCQKAHERLISDPSGAITSARAMLESAIKWIHHQRKIEPPLPTVSSARRLKDCLKLLGGEDNDFERPGVKPMVFGLEAAVNGLDEARNAMSDGHGKSPDAPEVSHRVARLIVELATTVTTFLLATYESRQRP